MPTERRYATPPPPQQARNRRTCAGTPASALLASELDALRPIGPHPNCDEALGGRSELIVFYYRGGGEARVIFYVKGCVAVRNGRTARYGPGMGHGNDESHWADEALL